MRVSKQIFIFLFSIMLVGATGCLFKKKPTKQYFVIGINGEVEIFNVETWKKEQTLTVSKGYNVSKVAFSPRGNYLAVGLCCSQKKDNAKIEIYSHVKTGSWSKSPIRTFDCSIRRISFLAFDSKGKNWIAASIEGKLFKYYTLLNKKREEEMSLEYLSSSSINKYVLREDYLGVLSTHNNGNGINIYQYKPKTFEYGGKKRKVSKWQNIKSVTYEGEFSKEGYNRIKSIAFVPKKKEISLLYKDLVCSIPIKKIIGFEENEKLEDVGHTILETSKGVEKKYKIKKGPFEEVEFTSFAFSPDGKQMALGLYHKEYKNFHYTVVTKNIREKKFFSMLLCNAFPNELLFSSDGRFLAIRMGDKSIGVHKRGKTGVFDPVEGFADLKDVTSMAFSPKIKLSLTKGGKKKKPFFTSISKEEDNGGELMEGAL